MQQSKKEVKKIIMHTLFKPCGTEVRVNENSLEHGLSIGWAKKEPKETK